MKDLQLVVFDWDGTLMDSMSKIVTCAEKAFDELGFEKPPSDDIRACIGLGLDEIWRRLYKGDEPDARSTFVDVYRKHWLSWQGPESRLYDGVNEALSRLREDNFYVAIATGKNRVGLDRDLSRSGIRHHFDASRCADEARSKPHPEMMEYLINYFGVEPEQTVMVGDTEFDIQMARGAGTSAIAVTYGAHEHSRLDQSNPDAMIDHLRHLNELIKPGYTS